MPDPHHLLARIEIQGFKARKVVSGNSHPGPLNCGWDCVRSSELGGDREVRCRESIIGHLGLEAVANRLGPDGWLNGSPRLHRWWSFTDVADHIVTIIGPALSHFAPF
jgi:hypothetical protein